MDFFGLQQYSKTMNNLQFSQNRLHWSSWSNDYLKENQSMDKPNNPSTKNLFILVNCIDTICRQVEGSGANLEIKISYYSISVQNQPCISIFSIIFVLLLHWSLSLRGGSIWGNTKGLGITSISSTHIFYLSRHQDHVLVLSLGDDFSDLTRPVVKLDVVEQKPNIWKGKTSA